MLQFDLRRTIMKEKQKITKYPGGNKKTETFIEDGISITKHFHNEKDAYVKELISLKDGIKTIKHINSQGIVSKLEHFLDDKRHGEEIKYIVSKADGSIKSTKNYDNGKLHGESITYNQSTQIIKHEVFALGKLVLKYLRESDENNDITGVNIIDKENLVNLSKNDHERLQTYI